MQKSEETRQKILTAALVLFRTQGFEKSTMRDVAQRAGVATGAAYYYFDSKDALVLAFYEQAAEEIGPLARKAAEGVKGLAAKLREVMLVKLDYFPSKRGSRFSIQAATPSAKSALRSSLSCSSRSRRRVSSTLPQPA